MSVPFRIGVLQLSMEPLEQTVRMAQACDRAGFDIFWLAEAYPWWRKHGFEARSSTAITAVVAAQTQRIIIGWGIISPYTRHPVQIAMEARVMQDAAGDGRFLLGLGASKIFMKEIGEGEKGKDVGPAWSCGRVSRSSPRCWRGMRSIITATHSRPRRRALKDEAHVSRARVPIYVGATGPVLQRLAGSHSDGLLTASITTPEFVRYARGNMEEGAKKAGKDPAPLDLGGVIVGSINRDSKKGKEGAREMAAMYLANKVQNIRGSADVLLQKAGLTFEEIAPIADAMEKGGRKAAAQAVTDDILQAKPAPSPASPTSAASASKHIAMPGAPTSCWRSGATIARNRRNCLGKRCCRSFGRQLSGEYKNPTLSCEMGGASAATLFLSSVIHTSLPDLNHRRTRGHRRWWAR